ncbi:hypothetical protein [Inhella proteolytica]|uniref:Solute-binding protein family 3/N-terminal domain-containing protein n=1 Tax=Inhella proteolytica TaxID=2795029 RepID=A0A931NI43_9BURK|nr:hypothetical protein [Inhella proteolytica]MBH9578941.1 hypothetical protein [Inhella proteolytica]
METRPAGRRSRSSRMVLALLSLACALPAWAAERLVWAGSPYAPMAIASGPLKGQGYVDRMIAEVLQPGLPQFRHEQMQVSPNRLELELLRTDIAVCSPAMSKAPQRLERYRYTQPLFRFLPAGVVLRREQALRSGPGPLALQQLLAQGLRFGVVGYRAYGPRVDALLERHEAQRQRFILSQSNQAVLAMLARGHGVDAVLVYGFELRHFALQQPELGAELVWRPLQELDDTQLSYTACSRNPAGERAARAIDALLQQPGVRERLQGLYEAWLDEEGQRQLQALRQRMEAQFWQE